MRAWVKDVKGEKVVNKVTKMKFVLSFFQGWSLDSIAALIFVDVVVEYIAVPVSLSLCPNIILTPSNTVVFMGGGTFPELRVFFQN